VVAEEADSASRAEEGILLVECQMADQEVVVGSMVADILSRLMIFDILAKRIVVLAHRMVVIC